MSSTREPARTKACLIRMTPEEHARLMAEAAAEGITVQVLGERRLLGKRDAQVRPRSTIRRPAQPGEFPLTG